MDNQTETPEETSESSNLFDRAVEENLNCYMMCRQAVDYCLQTGGDYIDPDRLHLLEDCSQTNLLMTDFLLRGSDFADEVALLTANICDATATSMADLEDTGLPESCAEACRSCASVCREMTA